MMISKTLQAFCKQYIARWAVLHARNRKFNRVLTIDGGGYVVTENNAYL